MICLLLIMTMVFINSSESAEQKIRHSDTLLKEEEMNAKTKAWLLMVESGRVDQDELRRITPKSIFIAPLLTNGAAKCKEGYRHDHLGQCVKVIKIDPKLQLELLLQRLNKLYGDKNDKEEDKSEEEKEEKDTFEVSNGPLQFSLPVSNSNQKADASQKDTKVAEVVDLNNNATTTLKDKPFPEFIPVPLPIVSLNQTNQTKEIESSGAEPLNETETFETSHLEGSGSEASGDEALGEETTTEPPVSLISEETDYLDTEDVETTTAADTQTTTESPMEILTTTNAIVDEENSTESYQNSTDNPNVNATVVKETTAEEEVPPKPNPNSAKIVFPTDEGFRTRIVATAQDSRIRFPDEVHQMKSPSYQPPPEVNYKSDKYQIHSSAIPQEQFWWLPKNWQIDENQRKSALVKVWSRLPLIHDIAYSQGSPEGFKPPRPSEQPYPRDFNPHYEDVRFGNNGHHHNYQRTLGRSIKPFRSNRFRDIVQTERQHYRIQR